MTEDDSPVSSILRSFTNPVMVVPRHSHAPVLNSYAVRDYPVYPMPKFTGLRFFPDSTKVIFLDLEYYVPASDRARKTPTGMLFSPFRPGHLVLGGTFMTYFPMHDRFIPPVSIWSWKEGSEKAALAKIFALLQKEWHVVESKEGLGSLMLSGIGISHSDVPTLISKLVINEVADPVRITDVMCGFRQIDLTTATYCQFAFNNSYFAYPKTKSQLYQKYLDGKILESGKSVWELYEAKDSMQLRNDVRKKSLTRLPSIERCLR
jgi:hypothetical protein